MSKDYIKTDTMRIKISGSAFRDGNPLDDLDIDTDFSSPSDVIDSETYEREFNELLECVYDAVIITDTKGKYPCMVVIGFFDIGPNLGVIGYTDGSFTIGEKNNHVCHCPGQLTCYPCRNWRHQSS